MVNRALTPPRQIPPGVGPLVDAFLDWARVERGFAPQTLDTYRRGIERFITETGLDGVEAIGSRDVLRVKRSLMDRGCSNSYVAVIVLSMRSMLAYCREVRGLAVLDPALLTPPKRPRRAVTFLTRGEVERFVNSIKLENRWVGRRRQRSVYGPGLLFRALVETLLGSGMRISEALSLRRGQVDWVRQEARVVGKGNKERAVFFTSRSLSWLRRYLASRQDDDERLFVASDGGGPIGRHDVVRWFARQSRVAGLNKRVTAHVLRHTVATTLMFNGCPMGHIKEILGHERLDTTCRYYLGLDQGQAKAALLKWLRFDGRAAEVSTAEAMTPR